jgi:hypothetical protein
MDKDHYADRSMEGLRQYLVESRDSNLLWAAQHERAGCAGAAERRREVAGTYNTWILLLPRPEPAAECDPADLCAGCRCAYSSVGGDNGNG